MTKKQLDEEVAKELQAKFQQQLDERLKASPEVVRKAAEVIRNKDLRAFRKFLRRNNIAVPNEHAEAFRDYIITQRIDLKDLEPEARARLRAATLKGQEYDNATEDYLQGKADRIDLRCRDCVWFVKAPNDNVGDNHDKSCVALGTKGTDEACFGFIWDLSRTTKPA